MLSKNKKQLLLQLRQKKFRQKYNKFIVEGEKIAIESLNQREYSISEILCTETWLNTHMLLLKPFINRTLIVTEKELKEISTLTNPPEVILIMEMPDQHAHTTFSKSDNQSKNTLYPVILYLDGIQDPGNMGAILRIADWFGIQQVYCNDNCVDCFNSKVIQSGMGAFLRIITEELTLQALVERFPEHLVYGATMNGVNVFQTNLQPGILVIGNEGNGISAESESLLNVQVSIPGNGKAESLNAAVATGILVSRFFEKLVL